MIGLLLGRVRVWLLAAGAALLALAGVYLAGRQGAAQKARTDALEGYAKTRKEIDDATDDLGSDPHVLRDWLRERAKH